MACSFRSVLALVIGSAFACSGSNAGGGAGAGRPPPGPVAPLGASVEWEVPGDYWSLRRGWWRGDRAWELRDLDGDGLRDLVDLAERRVGHGFPDRPHWRFHRNTGAGFAAVAEWPLPPGGDPECGLCEFATSDADEGDLWFVHDVTGDRRPDLVFTGRFDQGGTRAILGGAADPHWKVHRNLGDGFALEAERWPIPAAEAHVALGWVNVQRHDRISSGDYPAGTLVDLDGDGLADLVVTSDEESDEFAGPKRVPGHAAGTPHWRLFRGTGSGFESTPVRWPVPAGAGSAPEGRDLGGYADVASGDRNDLGEIWVLRDLDGDARPDLAVTGVRDVTWACRVARPGAEPAWVVYPNTGSGFGEAKEWPVPVLVGPVRDDGFCKSEKPYEYEGRSYSAPHWELLDLDADGAPELVQTNEGVVAGDGSVAAVSLRLEDGRPVWRVHAGGAGGFGPPRSWILPAELPGLAVMSPSRDREPAWMLADMTGDRHPDLVVVVRDPDGVTRRWRVLPYVP